MYVNCQNIGKGLYFPMFWHILKSERKKRERSMKQEFYEKLCEILREEGQVLLDEPLKKHTTFRIGGPAKYFCLPGTWEELAAVIRACREFEESYYILGNGSNILASDQGYSGVVIQIFQNRNEIRIEGTRLYADAGALLVKASHLAAREGLTGLEFASGIPGTIGGALVMNAGAYGGEMKDVVREALVLTEDGEQLRLSGEQLELGYRTSSIARQRQIVLEAVLELKQGDKKSIEARMKELKEARTEKQPLEYPSAGSTFKRPEGHFAGKLIMDAGLRGFRVGDAQVAEKHCGFLINRGNAAAEDVLALVSHVQKEVRNQFGVELELEVKLLGF